MTVDESKGRAYRGANLTTVGAFLAVVDPTVEVLPASGESVTVGGSVTTGAAPGNARRVTAAGVMVEAAAVVTVATGALGGSMGSGWVWALGLRRGDI